QVPLLPTQSAYLLPARVRHPAGKHWRSARAHKHTVSLHLLPCSNQYSIFCLHFSFLIFPNHPPGPRTGLQCCLRASELHPATVCLYRDPCSASLNEDDNHTIKLVGNQQKRAITLAKTCENTNELRDCRAPKDWSILALQNTRTGKSHYLVICKCPPHYRLEGPLAHDQPTYAGLPGINVYGMLCVPPETSSYYASKPAKTPASSTYNKWKVPSRQPVSSYRANSAAITAATEDTQTESVSFRTYQNTTDGTVGSEN
ncbi:AGAP013545-PA, partial [Anopheles gambiae str. PEST]|uniref:Uncharacterized protein n=2 Tax=gambiae species complex TaxID=44542 RepID=A0A6E8W7B0_ANOCL